MRERRRAGRSDSRWTAAGRLRIAALLLSLFVLASGNPAAADTPGLKGRSLIEAIAVLEQQGLVVYYSSDLVRPWMKVKEEPKSTAPGAQLDEILQPHELATEPAPGGGVLIVRRRALDVSPGGSILGIVSEAGSGRRISGVEVRLVGRSTQTISSPRGQFSFKDLSPGKYTIHAGSAETPALATQQVSVEPGKVSFARISIDAPQVRRLDSLVVNASRYELAETHAGSFHYLPVDEIATLPDMGDDPMRAMARLPGTATGGFTAKSNIRGGERDETLIRYDGLRLRNPYHLKDFQSVFSAIDPTIISGMDVYTGVAQPRFGDRMSAVIDIQPVEVPLAPVHEMSQSLYNSSLMSAGSMDDGRVDWAFAARRGNLDLLLDVLDPDLGDPSYVDAFGRLGVQVTDSLRVTGNVMVFDDDIKLSDTDQEENAKATYRDQYYWVRFDHDLGAGLAGYTILSHTDLQSDRKGTTDKEGVSAGSLHDQRSFTINSMQTGWSWTMTDRLAFDVGAEASKSDGNYDFEDEVEYQVLFLTPGAPTETVRTNDIDLDPSGSHYGAYVNSRYKLFEGVTTDVGLRWDRQTLTEDDEDLFSPRIAALVELADRTTLRAAWGRHYQSQGINELQVNDGLTEYFRSQRADHAVVSLEHRSRWGIDFRLEGYVKEMDRLRPRFENLLNTKILLPELKPDRIEIAPQSAQARGIELSMGSRSEGPLAWWFSYSWSTVKDKFDDDRIVRTWDQQDAIKGGVEWQRGPWTVSVAATYNTGWATTATELAATDPVPLVAVGPRNGERFRNYGTLDMRVARDWRLPNSYLSAFVELTNITNRRNNCCQDYEVEDVNDDGNLVWSLDKKRYFPVVPNIGVVWRFGPGAGPGQ
jgi:hypothetical protein